MFFLYSYLSIQEEGEKNHKIDRYRSLFSNLYDPLRIQTSHDPKETISTAKFKNGEAWNRVLYPCTNFSESL